MIEKLCLCLYFSCMKLNKYIKLVDVYVSSHCDVTKHMLSKPILHSLIGKWALALTAFSLTYMPLRVMKGQIVADFVVDHGIVEPSLNMVDTKPWILYFDGSSQKMEHVLGSYYYPHKIFRRSLNVKSTENVPIMKQNTKP